MIENNKKNTFAEWLSMFKSLIICIQQTEKLLVECKNVVEFDENGDFWPIVQLLKDELQNESFAYNAKPHDAKVMFCNYIS